MATALLFFPFLTAANGILTAESTAPEARINVLGCEILLSRGYREAQVSNSDYAVYEDILVEGKINAEPKIIRAFPYEEVKAKEKGEKIIDHEVVNGLTVEALEYSDDGVVILKYFLIYNKKAALLISGESWNNVIDMAKSCR